MSRIALPIWQLSLVTILAGSLAGCTGDTFSKDMGGFKPIEFFSKQDWSTVSAAKDSDFDRSRAVTADDFIDTQGLCTGMAAAPADTTVGTPAGDLRAMPASAGPAGPVVVGGVALGMTECEVVRRAGQPANVVISADANNDRATVLTYPAGAWPGIYRFSAGRLKEIERVAEPPPPPKVAKKQRAAKPKTAPR